jgi:hypothetical protein
LKIIDLKEKAKELGVPHSSVGIEENSITF